MDALVMCGGRGTRLDFAGEKPLLEIDGRPMIDRVLAALDESRIEQVVAVGSPFVPRTKAHVDVPVIEAPGGGYVSDLSVVLERVETPVLTVSADLPLIQPEEIDWILESYDTGSAMVAVPAEHKRTLGLSVDSTLDHRGRTVEPAGVNVVGPTKPNHTIMTTKTQFAINVNRPGDAWIATVFAGDDGS